MTTDAATDGRWVALLRGINVGGSNPLAMVDLRATAASLGWSEAATYIQSGNLVFSTSLPASGSPEPSGSPGSSIDVSEAALAERLRAALSERHGLDVPVVVRTASEIARIAAAHPGCSGPIEPKLLHVMLLDSAPATERIGRVHADAYLPDTWTLDGREIYVAYPNGSGRSRLTVDVFERAWGVTATARNLNSMRRIAAMAQA